MNRIICKDSVEAMKELPDRSVDLIFADPPYWMRLDGVLNRVNGSEYQGCDDEWDNRFSTLDDYREFTRAWLTECKRILKPNGSFWVIGGMQCIYTIGAIMQELGFWFINDVVWFKKNPTPNFKGTRINNAHETLIWATKSRKSKYTFHYKTAKELNRDNVGQSDFEKGVRKQLGSVWRISLCQGAERVRDSEGHKLHSAQKPEELLYRIIALTSNLNDVVLDPFGGTMTTGAVAKSMGRRYICIDNDPRYCEYGERRLAKIEPVITEIETAAFDKKPPRAPMASMIAAGYFHADELFYYEKTPYYRLTETGKLVSLADGKETDMHSAIALLKGGAAKRMNGWDFWQVMRGGTLTGISEVRKNYLREVLDYV